MLPNSLYNTRCVVRWICLLALRTGAVHERTWEQLEAKIHQRGHLGIVWKRPDKPLFSGHASNSGYLSIDRGMHPGTYRKYMMDSCLLIGMVNKATPHAIRYGSIREAADYPLRHLDRQFPNQSIAQQVACHNNSTTANGLTREYMGDDLIDMMEGLAESPPSENPGAPVVFVDEAQRFKKQRLTTAEVNIEIERRAASGQEVDARSTVRWQLREKQKSDWRQQMTDSINAPSDSVGLEEAPVSRSSIAFDVEKLLAVDDEEYTDLDAKARRDILVAPTNEYMKFFSTYNVVLHAAECTVFEGSADPPIAYLWVCANKKFGCLNKSKSRGNAEDHAKICPFTSEEYAKSRPFACKEGCGISFAKKTDFNNHMWFKHNYKPRQCGREGCTSTEIFATRSLLIEHQRLHDNKSRRCPVQDCKSKVEFLTLYRLRAHIRQIHKLQGEELNALTPLKGRRLTKGPQRCPLPDCSCELEFPTAGKLRTHLRRAHHLPPDAVDRLCPTADIVYREEVAQKAKQQVSQAKDSIAAEQAINP